MIDFEREHARVPFLKCSETESLVYVYKFHVGTLIYYIYRQHIIYKYICTYWHNINKRLHISFVDVDFELKRRVVLYAKHSLIPIQYIYYIYTRIH